MAAFFLFDKQFPAIFPNLRSIRPTLANLPANTARAVGGPLARPYLGISQRNDRVHRSASSLVV
jgi:hypothetical protein